MRAVVILFLLSHFLLPVAMADEIASHGDDWVRTTQQPCTNEAVLRHLPPGDDRADYRTARARFQGQEYAACWKPISGGVGLLYEDGDQGVVPQRAFRSVPEA